MNIRPGTIAMLAGGILLFISLFLDWHFIWNVFETDIFGFTGIFLLIIAIGTVVVAAIQGFAPHVNLPQHILGFSLNQVVLGLGFAAFIWAFSLMFRDGSEEGVILGWIGAAAIIVGAVLEDRAGPASTTPPTPF